MTQHISTYAFQLGQAQSLQAAVLALILANPRPDLLQPLLTARLASLYKVNDSTIFGPRLAGIAAADGELMAACDEVFVGAEMHRQMPH